MKPKNVKQAMFKFQFLLVRLKVDGAPGKKVTLIKFQFLLVRLKGCASLGQPPALQYFNSFWYD